MSWSIRSRSVAIKLLLPLLLAGSVLAGLLGWINHRVVESRLARDGVERALAVAHSAALGAETVPNPGDLQRLVAALGAEPDIDRIVVVSGQPLRVIASTRFAWMGQRLDSLPGLLLRPFLAAEPSRAMEQITTDTITGQLVVVVRFLEAGADSGTISPIARYGGVGVRMDQRALHQGIRSATEMLTLTMFGGMAGLALLAFLILRATILKPMGAIGEAIGAADPPRRAEALRRLAPDEIGRLGIQLDVALKRAEADEARLQSVLASVQEVICETDPMGRWSLLSPAWEQLTGLTVAEGLGRSAVEIVHADDRQKMLGIIEASRSGALAGMLRATARVVHRSGASRWVEGEFMPKPGGGFAGILRDVTDRKSAEDAQRLQTEFERGVLDAMDAQVAVIAGDGGIRAVNLAWRQFAAANALPGQPTPANADVGANYLSVCRGAAGDRSEEASAVYEGIVGVLAGSLPKFELEYPCHCSTEQRWFHLNVTPLGKPVVGAVIAHLNITERKRSAEALRVAHDQLALHLEHSPLAIIEWDREFRVLQWIGSAERIFGWTAAEVVGRSPKEFAWQVQQGDSTAERALAELASGRASYVMLDTENHTASGATVRCRSWNTVVRDPEGRPKTFFSIVQDMSEYWDTQQALARSEERLNLAVGGTSDGIWDWDIANETIWRSPRFSELLGYGSGEIPTSALSRRELIHPDDRTRVETAIQAHFELRIPYGVEYRLRRKDESWCWVQSRGQAVWGPDGRPTRFAGSMTDVSERRRAQEDLARSEERFALAIQGTSDGIWDWDLETNMVWYSARHEQLLGYEPQEFAGHPDRYSALVHPEDVERFRDAFREHLTRRTIVDIEYRARHRDGGWRWLRGRGQAIWDSAGRPLRMAGSTTDVHARKATETALQRSVQELAEARDRAEAGTRAKSEFLATMSHEIRTPMNGVLGMTTLLLDTHLDAEQRDYAETIRGSADALLAVINDILDFSKVEAGKLAIEIVPCDVRQAIEEVADLLAPRVSEKGLELAVVYPATAPAALLTDPGRLRQILLNLVGNAIKFTEAGAIAVEVASHDRPSGSVLAITVRDTGIGIAPESLSRLFGRFEQADASTTRRYGGTGLGLAISRRLAELLGGGLEVSSEVGVGSSFTLVLPGRWVANAAPVADDDPVLTGLRVLVVDDLKLSLRVFQGQLANAGVEVLTAESAKQGVAVLAAAADRGEPVPVVICDHLMPGADGEAFARMVLERFGTAAPRVILASSSGGAVHDPSLFTTILAKPVPDRKLLSEVHRALVLSQGTGPGAEIQGPVAATLLAPGAIGPRILLVEDNVVNQKVASKMLRKLGCRVDVAANGLEALDMTARFEFDLVFMDCLMPEMDGFTATEQLRQRETDRRLPIVAMTANAMAGDREQCLAAGMDDYIAKPVAIARLAEVLRMWVPKGERAVGAQPLPI